MKRSRGGDASRLGLLCCEAGAAKAVLYSAGSGRVAELADALGSGSSELTLVGVQVPPRPPSSFALWRLHMVDVNNGDAFEDVTQGERKRRQKKMLPKPLLRLLVALAAVIIVVVVIVVAVTSAMGTDEAADYQQYMTSVADLLKQSDSIGGRAHQAAYESRATPAARTSRPSSTSSWPSLRSWRPRPKSLRCPKNSSTRTSTSSSCWP